MIDYFFPNASPPVRSRTYGGLASDLRREISPLKQWMKDASAVLVLLRDELSGVRRAVGPMSEDLDALRGAFAGTNDELEQLCAQLVPELRSVGSAVDGVHEEVHGERELIENLNTQIQEMGQLLATGLATMTETIKPLVRDADEVRDVVEPLQAATERVGRVAQRLPGPGCKR